MNKKVCILVVMLLISGFSINISGNVSALNINVNDKIDIHNEIGDFFDNWKTKEENGVSSYQVGETLEKLKIYKDKMEDESNYDDELLLELDSEIMWLEYVLEGVRR